MIIILILIGIALISGILYGLIYSNGWDFCIDEEAFAAVSGVFIFIALVCGIIAGCINMAPEATVLEWEEHICYLENQKEMLESVKPVLDFSESETISSSDVYFHFDNVQEYYNAVGEYNKEVERFVTEIKAGKLKKKNPWINWFVSKAYDMIDLEKIESLRYSKGK